jgi:hypothetical protein
MLDIDSVSTTEFNELNYIEKLNVYEKMEQDFFLCYRDIGGKYVGCLVDSPEGLSKILDYIHHAKSEYFYVKPSNLSEYIQLLNWMLGRKSYNYLIDYTEYNSHVDRLKERLFKSQFSIETLAEVKESVSKDYQLIRNRIIDPDQIHTRTDNKALFIRLGVDSHREGLFDDEKFEYFIKKLSFYQLQFSECFSFRGLIKAFNNYLSGYSFSQYYKFLIVDQGLDNPQATTSSEDQKPNRIKKLKGKRLKVMKLIVDEMKSGTQLTDAVDASYSKAGYKDHRQIWNIIKSIREGTLEFKEFTEIHLVN